MGVIYKFKKDIIDFILDQKRTDSTLSCRQLAVLINEQFRTHVSKSSVNAIIKNACLSSSVGRPAGFVAGPKRFQIPSQKKQQLSEEIRKVGIEKKQEASLGGGSKVYPGMGCVFLLAAQWMTCRKQFLGSLLRKYAKGPLPHAFDSLCDGLACLSVAVEDFPGKGSVLANKIRQYSSHGIWALNALGDGLSTDSDINLSLEEQDWIGAISGSLNLLLEYEKEKKQIFTDVGQFKIYLEDDSQLIIDARLSSLWSGKAPRRCSASLEQATAMLSHGLVSNNQPVIFLSLTPKFCYKPEDSRVSNNGRQLDRSIFNLAAAFEGSKSKKMLRVEVFDLNGQSLAEFSSLPSKKRIFMLGVWPGQAGFELLANDIKTVDNIYHIALKRVMYYAERSTTLPQNELQGIRYLKVVGVSGVAGGALDAVILTNDAHRSAKDVVGDFLERWPVLNTGPMGKLLAASPATFSEDEQALSVTAVPHTDKMSAQDYEPGALWKQAPTQDIGWLFQDFGKELHRYCLECFFYDSHTNYDITHFISAYYGLSGSCIHQDNKFLVSLHVPTGYAHAKVLQTAVDRLNESALNDPLGRRLLVLIA